MKTKLSAAIVTGLLATMTVAELTAVAKRVGVKPEKNKEKTIKALAKAIEKTDVKFTTVFYINTKPTSEHDLGVRVYQRKIRNHKDDVIAIPAPLDYTPSIGAAASGAKALAQASAGIAGMTDSADEEENS